MPRKARIDAPGALHHIILRGIERRKIFFDDDDRDNFLDRLAGIVTDTNTQCFAWALIPNHVHLLLRTGNAPMATVMQRLLTGYAVSFNRRHKRSGHLFQNRYKSILCEEEPYLLELVRYIHLNPLRAKLADGLGKLDRYPYGGHSALMGKVQRPWQNVGYVLKLFGKTCSRAIRRYRDFVDKGIAAGRRPELMGGGLVRSAGGRSAVKLLRGKRPSAKGDERILGSGDFVEKVLREADVNLERKYAIRAGTYDFGWLVGRVAEALGMPPEDVLAPGRYKEAVRARSVLCYWGMRELGMTAVELAERLGLSQPSVSHSAKRGRKIAMERGLRLDLAS
jgi:REP element-mobilizing transposase RayT